MITLTSSLAAAIANPQAEPMVLVEIQTAYGVARVAREQLTWGGNDYWGRLVSASALGLTDVGANLGVLAPTELTLEIADADGYFGRLRPDQYQGMTVTVKEVMRDVDSPALRTFLYAADAAESDTEKWVLRCTDFWAPYRSKPVPAPALQIDPGRFPNADLTTLGTYIPLAWGDGYAPGRLVVETDREGVFMYGARNPVLGADQQTPFDLFQFWNGRMLVPASASINQSTTSWDGSVNPYSATTIPVALVGEPLRSGAGTAPLPIVAHWVAFRNGPQGTPEWIDGVTSWADLYPTIPEMIPPAEQLVKNFATNTWYGAGVPAALVDSGAICAAGSAYFANGLRCDGVLEEPVTFGELLGAFAHDTLTRVLLRDRLYLTVQQSRAPVYSFHAGNIMPGTLKVSDRAASTLELTHQVIYRDVNAGNIGLQSQTGFSCGSGGQTGQHEAIFLGRYSQAQRAAQFWAKYEQVGVRGYQLQTTCRAAALEEGDLVTVQDSVQVPSPRVCEVVGISRQHPLLTFTLREFDNAIFLFETGSSVMFKPFERHRPDAPHTAVGSTFSLFTSSHGLGVVPTSITAVCPAAGGFVGWAVASIVTATGSDFTVMLHQIGLSGFPDTTIASLGGALFYFDCSVPLDAEFKVGLQRVPYPGSKMPFNSGPSLSTQTGTGYLFTVSHTLGVAPTHVGWMWTDPLTFPTTVVRSYVTGTGSQAIVACHSTRSYAGFETGFLGWELTL